MENLLITVDSKTGIVQKVVSQITVVGIKPDVATLVRELRETGRHCTPEEFADKHLCEVSGILNNQMIDRLLNEAMERAKRNE